MCKLEGTSQTKELATIQMKDMDGNLMGIEGSGGWNLYRQMDEEQLMPE